MYIIMYIYGVYTSTCKTKHQPQKCLSTVYFSMFLCFSTYSNLYNHPTKITEPTDSVKKQIRLSRKTGIPLGAVPGPLPKTHNQPPNRGTCIMLDMHVNVHVQYMHEDGC